MTTLSEILQSLRRSERLRRGIPPRVMSNNGGRILKDLQEISVVVSQTETSLDVIRIERLFRGPPIIALVDKEMTKK